MNETKFKEYKDFMDKDFITYLSNHYLLNVFHRYGHTSIPGTGGKTFFATEMHQDVVSNFVTHKLIKKFGVNQFKRIYINLKKIQGVLKYVILPLWHHLQKKQKYIRLRLNKIS